MKLIFFNLCVSPHQMPYINELAHHADVEYVAFVAPMVDIDERAEMGWHAADSMTDNNVEFFIDPDDGTVTRLFKLNEGPDTHCVFSGINAFEQVSRWLRMSISYDVKRDIMTEPPMIFEHPLWLHAIRFALQDWRYVKHIDNVFVTGDRFVPYYKMWSRHWNVVPFMYCTDLRATSNVARPTDERLHLVYVGELCRRKNVMLLLEALARIQNVADKVLLDIVGDGAERSVLEAYANGHHLPVVFHGRKPMNRVADYMLGGDVLVLPSRHDGWGAVVNEALSLGLYVICSDHCGARYLINKLAPWIDDFDGCGLAFRSDDAGDLRECVENCMEKIDFIRSTTDVRIDWSRNNISSKAVAEYFINVLKA